ncbi:radical SAM protein [archaeon]|nr:radical SAM protein [archaeon]MBL7057007.1 radical SAM protein [Candidatus Woesearchaeota archaeon]
MTDVLLFIPRYKWNDSKKADSCYPPIGVAILASNLEKNSYSVSIRDANVEPISEKEFIGLIKKEKPSLFGLSISDANIPDVKRWCLLVKKISAHTKIVIGCRDKLFLKNNFLSFADYFVIGEAEETIVELSDCIIKRTCSLKSINGLAYFEKNVLVMNSLRKKVSNLNKLPFPAYHLLSMNLYKPYAINHLGKRFTAIISSRGCAFKCSFCSIAVANSHTWRPLSAANTIALVEYLHAKHGITHIHFQDDEFLIDSKRAAKICTLMRSKFDKEIVWECRGRAANMSETLASLLASANCIAITFGIELGYQEGLDKIKKQTTIKQIEKAVEVSRENHLQTKAGFMLGFPWETKEDVQKTIDFAKKLPLDFAGFTILIPFEGTEMYALLKKERLIVSSGDTFSKKNGFEFSVNTKFLSYRELVKLKLRAQKQFYLRPTYFLSLFFRSHNLLMLKRCLKTYFYSIKAIIWTSSKLFRTQ